MRPVHNPPNPYEPTTLEWLDEPPPARLEVFEEEARRVLTENKSPDLPFRFSLNPYRGCVHACAYCYARPTHQYLGFGAGTDFDRKIVVKVNAPEALLREVSRPSFRRDVVALSGNTDCYQPLEAGYRLTRRCLEVLEGHDVPVGVITKSALVARDADVLARMRAVVTLSVPFADDDAARRIEPWAARPSRRLEALRRLSEAGVETGVAIAPIIPGLNDADIPEILERAKEAGATRAFMTLLRLPREVHPVFTERLEEAFPDRYRRVLHALEEVRGGKHNESRFGSRFVGRGPRWQIIERVFEQHAKRLGLSTREKDASPVTEVTRLSSKRPRQGELF